MRLKGEAKSLDIAKLQYETEWLMHKVTSFDDEVQNISETLVALKDGSDRAAPTSRSIVGTSPMKPGPHGARKRISVKVSA
mmetsp:Transcript_45944/g.130293  ORF Transcript_45944/g.130293 Transcript_45944/m.130293 type:complete len:81 (-) Transcript_45944:52-294(-)